MVGNGLERRCLRWNLASVASGAHEVHGMKDDHSLSGFMNLKDEKRKASKKSSANKRGTSLNISSKQKILNKSGACTYNMYSSIKKWEHTSYDQK